MKTFISNRLLNFILWAILIVLIAIFHLFQIKSILYLLISFNLFFVYNTLAIILHNKNKLSLIFKRIINSWETAGKPILFTILWMLLIAMFTLFTILTKGSEIKWFENGTIVFLIGTIAYAAFSDNFFSMFSKINETLNAIGLIIVFSLVFLGFLLRGDFEDFLPINHKGKVVITWIIFSLCFSFILKLMHLINEKYYVRQK
jgi:hypothetical protein